jgi:hypothetical protein
MSDEMERRIESLPPDVQPMVRALVERVEHRADHRVPLEELMLDREFAAEFAEVVARLTEDPRLAAEWISFWEAYAREAESEEEE